MSDKDGQPKARSYLPAGRPEDSDEKKKSGIAREGSLGLESHVFIEGRLEAQ